MLELLDGESNEGALKSSLEEGSRCGGLRWRLETRLVGVVAADEEPDNRAIGFDA